jgi:hypothetical protein
MENLTINANSSLAIAQLNRILEVADLMNKYLFFYSSLTFLPVGIIFNFITILIFQRKTFNSSSNMMGFYYSVLAIIDTISLAVGIVTYFPTSLYYDLRLISDVSCKLLWFLRRVLTALSAWFQVLITLDRTLNISYPNRFTIFKKKFNLLAITFFTLLTIVILQIGNFFYYREYYLDEYHTSQNINHNTGFSNSNDTSKFVLICDGSFGIVFSTSLLSILIRIVLPFVVMAGLNLKLIDVLIKSKRNFHKTKKETGIKLDKSLKKSYQFATTITSLNWIFFCFNFPLAIGLLLKNIFTYFIFFDPPEYLAISNDIYNIGTMLSFFHQALTFFINLRFNKLFRNEVKIMLGILNSSNKSSSLIMSHTF